MTPQEKRIVVISVLIGFIVFILLSYNDEFHWRYLFIGFMVAGHVAILLRVLRWVLRWMQIDDSKKDDDDGKTNTNESTQ